MQLCVTCQVGYWQRNTFILPLQTEYLYTTCNVFTFIWVQKLKITKLMGYTLDLAQTTVHHLAKSLLVTSNVIHQFHLKGAKSTSTFKIMLCYLSHTVPQQMKLLSVPESDTSILQEGYFKTITQNTSTSTSCQVHNNVQYL